MSNSSTTIEERGSEWRATSEANMILRGLLEAVNAPSGKQFARSRASRIERWQQLASVAEQQASGLAGLAKAAPRKAKAAKPNTADNTRLGPTIVTAETSA